MILKVAIFSLLFAVIGENLDRGGRAPLRKGRRNTRRLAKGCK